MHYNSEKVSQTVRKIQAVVTELFRLAGDSRHETETAWKFIRAGAIKLAVIEDSELPEVRIHMSRYWDRPMDFAAASGEP